MRRINIQMKYIILYSAVVLLFACQQPGGNVTGSEYMPDMAHSVAYEANYYNYYYQNTWGTEAEYYEFAKPKEPVAGTIPRTKVGDSKTAITFTSSGSVPYHYGNTDEERTRATNEIINNALPITAAGLARGKDQYTIFCGICHGDKGDGAGYLVRDDGGKYPVQPANLLLEEFVNASNGRYYHAIMYGKNLMGAYKDKLSDQERWEVIHYIRSLQAKSLTLEYSEEVNTLNTIDIPGATLASAIEAHQMHESMDHSSDSHEGEHDAEHHSDNH